MVSVMGQQQVSLAIEILWQNPHYLVVNKPSGLICAPSIDRQRENLLTQIQSQFPEKKIILPHRLDKETSGIVIFLCSEKSHSIGEKLFSDRLAKKTYLAVAQGIPEQERGELTHFLKKTKHLKIMKSEVVKSGGDKAILDYRVLATNAPLMPELSLLEIKLKTGRFHQIRAQLASLGHPLLGDNLYGGQGPGPFKLHAFQLEWDCPISGEHYLVESPLPATWGFWIERFSGISIKGRER